MRALLTLNAGSSSLKMGVFGGDAPRERLGTVTISGIGHDAKLRTTFAGSSFERKVTLRDHEAAIAAGIDAIPGHYAWAAIGHRITHGGSVHREPVVIDDDVRASIASLTPLAPLHQPFGIAGIDAGKKLAPRAVHVACFDTAFHKTMPDEARRYAVPRSWTLSGVVAYGFHGLSYEYIASALPEHLGPRADGRVIVAHLGSGASMCALSGRRSIATTMGYTPLDGLPMATRSGALDPGILLKEMENGLSAKELREVLYRRSGLLGVSGISGSMEELLSSGDPRAKEAVDLFVYRSVTTIGSLAAALGGLDALVFTAGIGENSAEIRRRVAERLAWLGAEVDVAKNEAGGPVFSAASSRTALLVLRTDEEQTLARHTGKLLDDLSDGPRT